MDIIIWLENLLNTEQQWWRWWWVLLSLSNTYENKCRHLLCQKYNYCPRILSYGITVKSFPQFSLFNVSKFRVLGLVRVLCMNVCMYLYIYIEVICVPQSCNYLIKNTIKTVFILIYFLHFIYLCDGEAKFSSATTLLYCCSMLKTLLLNIFLWILRVFFKNNIFNRTVFIWNRTLL